MEKAQTSPQLPRTRVSTILILLSCFVPSPLVGWEALAQSRQSSRMRADQAILRLESTAGQGVRVTRSTITDVANFASAGRSLLVHAEAGRSAEQRGLAFLRDYGDAFGLPDTSELQVVTVAGPDVSGMEHVRLRQLHRGIPVTGGGLIVHLKGTGIVAVSAKTLPDAGDIETLPSVSASRALDVARVLMEERYGLTDVQHSTPHLEVFNRGLLDGIPNPTRLAWFVEARHAERRQFIWIDAQKGVVLLDFNQLTDALSRAVYSSKHTYLLPGTLIRREGEPESGDSDVDAAFRYLGDAYQFFLAQFGRDSYDGRGSPILSTVHYGYGYRNASWNGQEIAFGDFFCQADDVVAHEWTHALTEQTAGLFYYVQSGALNESFSDIFGETIDLLNGSGNDSENARWLQGEDVPGGPFRNLMDPPSLKQPGKMSDAESFLCYDSLNDDRGGVHVNSGILNHAYALMVDGGTYNGRSIQGIGLIKAAHIMYRALTLYLGEASNFLDAYNAIIQAGNDLVGTMGITAGDVDEVTKSLDAVELSSSWPCAAPRPMIPDLTPTGSVPLKIFSDDLEEIQSDLWMTRTLWGLNQWSGGEGTDGLYWAGFARSGDYHFWGSNQSFEVDSSSAVEMTRDIWIPLNSRLQFNHSFGFQRNYSNYFDGGMVEFSEDHGLTWNDAGSLIVAGASYNGSFWRGDRSHAYAAFVGSSYGYTASQLDLGILAGKKVRFRFRMDSIRMDPSYQEYGWFIDDIHLYQVVPDYTLTVAVLGDGSGVVVSSPAGIQCGSQCSKIFARGSTVTLTAVPDANSTFSGWRGTCSGAGICSVVMTGARYAVAEFSPRSCRVVLSPTTVSFGPEGGDGKISVATPAGCGWAAAVDPLSPWISLTSESPAIEFEELRFHVAANAYAGSRKGKIAIGDQSLLIIQRAIAGWKNIGPEGGIVYALASSPADPTILYAGTSQGIYRSVDRGDSWNPVNEGLTLLDARSLAVDPNNPQIVYAAIFGAGVFKSLDGGAHWIPSMEGFQNLDAHYAASIVVDPQDSSRIFVGGSEFYISGDAGKHWVKPDSQAHMSAVSISVYPLNSQIMYVSAGRIYKTDSGGAGWIPCFTIGEPFNSTLVVAVHPSNPDMVLASLTPSGIQRSADGGKTWQTSAGTPGSMIVALVFDRLHPTTVYAGTSGDGIYRSTDAGISWSAAGNRSPHGFIRDVLFEPGNSSAIYAATYGGGVFKSDNGGQEWRASSHGLRSVQVHALGIDPQKHTVLYVGTDGGIFKSLDDGLTWQARNEGLTGSVVSALTIRADNPDIVYAGTNGAKVFKSSDGGLHWTGSSLPGSSAYQIIHNIFIDPNASEHVYAGTDASVYKSIDGGLTWTSTGVSCDRALAMDPSDGQVIYSAGYFSLYKSSDGGEHWKTSARGLPFNLFAPALVVDPVHPGTLFLSSYFDATVYQTTDGGEKWTALNRGSPGVPFAEILSDPSGRLFAGTSGAGVFQSRDGGRHWSDTNEGLTNFTIGVLAVDPSTPDLIYAGTMGSGVVRRYFEPPCDIDISPGNAGYGSAGGNGSIRVYAGQSCFWAAVSSDPWIQIDSGVVGSGEATITYQVAANPIALPRSGTVLVGGWSFVISQAGTVLTLSPSVLPEAVAGTPYQQSVNAAGGTGPYVYQIGVGTLPPGLSLLASGILSGTPAKAGRFDFVIVAADALNQYTQRDYKFVVKEACQFTLGSGGGSFGSSGGGGSVSVDTGDNCAWAVRQDPKDSWVTITTGLSGKGRGTIGFSVSANAGSRSRCGLLKVADQSFAVLQQGANQWISLGPNNSQVRDLKIVPSNSAVIYAGTGRGVFKSVDHGYHWVPLTSPSASAVDSLAVDPQDSRIVYSAQRDGLLKSVDGGLSWRSIQNGLPRFTGQNTIVISPKNNNCLILATYSGYYRSLDGGESWGPQRVIDPAGSLSHVLFNPLNADTMYATTSDGLFKSTDGGENWNRLNITSSTGGYLAVLYLAFDPVDPQIIYIASSEGLYKSTNGGGSISKVHDSLPNLRILNVATSPSNSRLIFAVVEGEGLFLSRDGGQYWEWATEKAIDWNDADYVKGVVVAGDPINQDLIYAGAASGLTVSTDGGRSWTARNAGLPRSFVNTVKIHPRERDVLFAGTLLDGLYRSEDGGSTWERVFWTREIQTIFTLTFHPTNPDIIYAGTEAGVIWSKDGGRYWEYQMNIGVCVYAIMLDPVESNKIYLGTFEAGVVKSTDGGLTWQIASAELEGYLPFASLVSDPGNHNVIYAGSWLGVHKSRDAGVTWQPSSEGLTDPRVSCLAVDPGNPQTLYAGTSSQGIFKSTDGAGRWRPINLGLADLHITALAVHPLFPKRIYAATGSRGVYVSIDGGDRWFPLDEGLESLRILSLEISPADPAGLYVGSDGGGIYRMESDESIRRIGR